jgi:glucose-1-phosphate thymidylyltransferase
MKIFIPMAGKGTRLRPFTLTCPKPLLKIIDKPIVEHLIDQITSKLTTLLMKSYIY